MDKTGDGLLLEILSYLCVKEIIETERVCKRVYLVLRKNAHIVWGMVKKEYLGKWYQDGASYQQIKDFVRALHMRSEYIDVFGFYTDGKIIWNNDTAYGIHSLFNLHSNAYSTEVGHTKNVLVKGIYSLKHYSWGELCQMPYAMSYISDNEIFLETEYTALSTMLNEFKAEAAFQEISIFTTSLCTTPCYRLMCFLSSYDLPYTDLIRTFHSCNSLESLTKTSDSLKLNYEILNGSNNTQVVFFKCKGNIQPLFWVDIEKAQHKQSVVSVSLKQQYIGSFIYILLIDAGKDDPNPCIDQRAILFHGHKLSHYAYPPFTGLPY